MKQDDPLRQIREELLSFTKTEDKTAFTDLFNRTRKILGLDEDRLAEFLRVSRPTIIRWGEGQSAPHPFGRKPVFTALGDLAGGMLVRQPKGL